MECSATAIPLEFIDYKKLEQQGKQWALLTYDWFFSVDHFL